MEKLIRTASERLAETVEAAAVAYQQTMQQAAVMYERLLAICACAFSSAWSCERFLMGSTPPMDMTSPEPG